MINILLLCDDQWHPAEIIEKGIQPLEKLYQFTIVKDAKDVLTPEYISRFPMIICCKSNVINASNTTPWFEDGVTEVTPKEFEEYVQAGGGFLSLHSGNTSRAGEAYTEFVGNYFNGHPPRCSVDLKTTENNHPIMEGIEDFTIRDEHYNIVLTCDDADVFCKTYSTTGGEQIGGYTRIKGDGRLCVLTPGHIFSVWENDMFQKLLHQAIQWCLKEK